MSLRHGRFLGCTLGEAQVKIMCTKYLKYRQYKVAKLRGNNVNTQMITCTTVKILTTQQNNTACFKVERLVDWFAAETLTFTR